ncbi:MAG TPA: hypothetical protein VID76_08190 [Solirubrobacterales bacterium]|jgi:hypothetical protein
MVRALVIALVLAIACAAGATAGVFSSVYETGTVAGHTGTNPYGAQLTQLPRCRNGATAVSGGFQTEFRIGDPASPSIYPTTFRRDASKWYVSAVNYGTGPGAMTSYVYCAKLEVSIAFVAMRAAGTVLENTARCPRGRVALAGGYVLDTAHEAPFALARSSRRAWTARAANPGGGEAGLTAYVVCGKPKQTGLRPTEVSVDVPFAAAGSGASATALPTCPAGRLALSGGFEAPSSADGVIVHESLRVGKRSWEVRASSQTPVAGTLTAFVYCV